MSITQSYRQLSPRVRFLVGVLMLAFANVCFSTKAILIKLLYLQGVDSASALALRMLCAVPFYLIILFWNRRQHSERLSFKQWLGISTLGIVSYYVSSMLDFMGLQYVSAGVERLVLFTYPSLVLLISAVLFKKKITPPQYLALMLTYLGIVVAFAAENGLGEQRDLVKGGLYVFGCAITYAIYVVFTGEYVHKVGSVRFTCYAITAATVPALVQSYVHNGLDIFHFSPEVYRLSVWLGLLATVLPTFMIVEGIRIVGANNAGIIGFVGPIATIGLAFVFLGEAITPLQIVGTIVVLAGVFLLSVKGERS